MPQPATHTFSAVVWNKNGDHPLDFAEPRIGYDGTGELVEYSGQHAKDNDWEGAVVRRFRTPGTGTHTCKECGYTYHHHGWIDSDPSYTVCPGDIIISTDTHKAIPCKPFLFHAAVNFLLHLGTKGAKH
jgi:hypothetical protein